VGAIEAGCVPDPAQLHPMSDALGLRYDKIAMLALSSGAWEVNPICRRPARPGTGAGTQPYKLSPEEKGGETDQESRSVRSQKSEHQLGNSACNAFKAATAAQGVDMTTVLQQFIEN